MKEGEGTVITEGCLGSESALGVGGVDGVDHKVKIGDTQYMQYTTTCHRHFGPHADGVQKGLQQVLWERGLYRSDMKLADCRLAMSRCADFVAEMTRLEKLFSDRGHILYYSVKGYCELAGEGVVGGDFTPSCLAHLIHEAVWWVCTQRACTNQPRS
jgi:hypothetical protein